MIVKINKIEDNLKQKNFSDLDVKDVFKLDYEKGKFFIKLDKYNPKTKGELNAICVNDCRLFFFEDSRKVLPFYGKIEFHVYT